MPGFNTHFYTSRPSNNDLYQRALAAVLASVIKSYNYAIFDPAREAFGIGLRCGEWLLTGESRQSPTPVRPSQFGYMSNGIFGLDFQIPDTYTAGFVHDDTFGIRNSSAECKTGVCGSESRLLEYTLPGNIGLNMEIYSVSLHSAEELP